MATSMAGSNEYNGEQLVVVAVAFLALTYLSVILRCFVRISITKAFAADDWLILAAQVNFTLSCSFILRGVHYGLGRHNDSLPGGERIQALKYQALATLTYVSNMMFIKLSIAIFLLRIAVQRRYIWILRISMVVVTIWSLAIFLYEIFQCTPVESQWDFTIKPSKCVSGSSFVSAAYSISVLTIVTDWMYAILPIPMIWSVKMSTQTKATVAFILSLGVFASIATLIRLKYLIELADISDILFTGTTAMVWTLVEPGVAITAASLVTIRPLLRALNFAGFESTENPTYPSGSHGHQNLSLRADLPQNNFSASSTSTQPKKPELQRSNSKASVLDRLKVQPKVQTDAVTDDGGSEEYILMGIRRTVDITVSRDSRSRSGRPT